MKFKLDENMPAEIVTDLRAAGHEADSVTEEGLGEPKFRTSSGSPAHQNARSR